MEKKYLIKATEPQTNEEADEKAYLAIVREVRALDRIEEYLISGYTKKERNYRYFDTFDTGLAKSQVVAYVGPLEERGISASLRKRENDYVLAVKFPRSTVADEREELEFPLPAEVAFDELNPEDFAFWQPLKRAKQFGGNKPLVEIVRLMVTTHRFDLDLENEKKVQVALDSVEVINPFTKKKFYELEVERLENGENSDVEEVCSYFTDKYKKQLFISPSPKWIKAHRLLRGEKLEAKEPDNEDIPF